MEYRCFCCDVDFDSQIAYEKHCKSDKHIKVNLDQPLVFWNKFTDKFLNIAYVDTKLSFCPIYLLCVSELIILFSEKLKTHLYTLYKNHQSCLISADCASNVTTQKTLETRAIKCVSEKRKEPSNALKKKQHQVRACQSGSKKSKQ